VAERNQTPGVVLELTLEEATGLMLMASTGLGPILGFDAKPPVDETTICGQVLNCGKAIYQLLDHLPKEDECVDDRSRLLLATARSAGECFGAGMKALSKLYS
jgi:hypothetical protein